MTIAREIADGLRLSGGGNPSVITTFPFVDVLTPTVANLVLAPYFMVDVNVYIDHVTIPGTPNPVVMRVSDDNGATWGSVSDYEMMLDMRHSEGGGSQPSARGAPFSGIWLTANQANEGIYVGVEQEGLVAHMSFMDPGKAVVESKCGIMRNALNADEGVGRTFHSGGGTFSRLNCGAIDAIQLWDLDTAANSNGQLHTGEFVIEGWAA